MLRKTHILREKFRPSRKNNNIILGLISNTKGTLIDSFFFILYTRKKGLSMRDKKLNRPLVPISDV